MATASAGETAADSGPQTAGAITPERAAGEQPPGSDGATNEAAEGAAGDASEALPNPSRAPGKLSASRAVVKWGSWAAVVVAIGFLALRFLVPFGPELRHPGKADAIANKDAPPAGAMVQPTPVDGTKSEANNNAPVSSPHDSVATAEAKKDVAVPRPAPPPVARPAAGVAVPDLAPYQEAVARLKVGGVMEGPAPRIYLDGRIVRCGEIINRNLGLRFMGVDAVNNAVLFTNADNVVFRKYY